MVPSLIRTITPFIVAAVITWAARFGLDMDEEITTTWVVLALGGLYYALARLAEGFSPTLGRWLLSLNTVKSTPKYERPVPPEPLGPLPPRIDQP